MWAMVVTMLQNKITKSSLKLMLIMGYSFRFRNQFPDPPPVHVRPPRRVILRGVPLGHLGREL